MIRMMARRLSIALGALAWLAGCPGGPGPGVSPDRVEGEVIRTARLTFVEGEVRIRRPADVDWTPARAGSELAINDKIRTLRDSFATVEFEEGGSLRIGPESLVKVTDLRLEPENQARRSAFTVVEGRVEAEVDPLKNPGSEFKIKTPSAEASVVRREVSFQ